MTDLPLVAIIIVVFNNADDTINCLSSLETLSYSNFQIILVDNGSKDDVLIRVRNRFPNTIIIENGENLGYAGGGNVGIKFAVENLNAEYYLILNSDIVILDKDFLTHLIAAFKGNKTIGVVAPIVKNLLAPHSIQCAGIKLNYYFGRARLITSIKPIPIWTDAVHGCAFMLNREVLDTVGLFDENFYLYWEETDYCIRVRQAGKRLLVNPDTYVLHRSGASIGGRGGLYTYYFFRNRLLLVQKHAQKRHRIVLSFLLPFYALVHVLKGVREGHSYNQIARAIVHAWRDFRGGRFGRKNSLE
jgi:GT2 family glycosyltransferase